MNKIYEVELPVLNEGWCFRARRIQLGKTLKTLATEAKVGPNTVRRLELDGRVEFISLLRIAPHLELSEHQALAMLAIQRQFADAQKLKEGSQ